MAHTPLYTFSISNNRVLQYKRNTSLQIARLHSFSSIKSKTDYISTGITLFYKNLLACSNHDGSIVIVDIFTRKKRVIKIPKTQISRLTFLNKKNLLTVSIDGLVKVHDLKTLSTYNVTDPSLVALLKDTKELSLQSISSSILTPLLKSKALSQAFGLIDDNPWLKASLEHEKLESIYRLAFSSALKALREDSVNKAHSFLIDFSDVSSKQEEIKNLFIDFKHYERFKLHISEKKYSIAYALCSKHPLLKLTPEYIKMENIFNSAFKLAHEQILLSQKETAKETLGKYMTILSKRDKIKQLLNGKYVYENSSSEKGNLDFQNKKLLLAYEKNSFKECYELIDLYSMEDLELINLLEKHWVKLMIECEKYALQRDIKAIKKSLGELITTKTRTDKIGDLLRVAFISKIVNLQEERNFNSTENIIYSYIDIFGLDVEIGVIMKEYEKTSLNKLAITENQDGLVLRNDWLNAALIVEF